MRSSDTKDRRENKFQGAENIDYCIRNQQTLVQVESIVD